MEMLILGRKPETDTLVRIFLYTPLYPPYRGGSASYYSNLVESLSGMYDFTVLTSYHTDRPLVTNQNGATVYRVVPRLSGIPRPLRMFVQPPIAFAVSLFLIVTGRIDLLHTHSTSLGTLGVAASAALSRRRIVYDCRDEDFPPALVKIGSTPIWFSCASNIDDKLRQSGILADSIIRTPVANPPYVSEYRSKPILDDDLSVVYVGALRREKGVLLLCRAFRQLLSEHPDATLTIVGDGPAKDAVVTSVRGCSNQVALTGELEHRAALERITSADVLVLPSASEGTPRVVREALEIGTPVIASPAGDVSKLVSHGVTGLVVERSEEAIVAALRRLAEDRKLARQLRQNCLEGETGPTWDTAVSRVSEGYDRALSA
ncbi:glycosyltransferase family 4 protein [Halosimplex amylolyticum]|uniref:glycosyltransferase family 4 protein n=1 Tax=Halosimplex amylolyticum TaxID=3396616 RepID=UPI003F572FEB